jgi:hypothetical protein
MMKKLCYLNYKYDNLKEPNRTLFFFFVLMPLICLTQIVLPHFMGVPRGYLCWAFMMLVIVFIRMAPTFYFLIHGKDYKQD